LDGVISAKLGLDEWTSNGKGGQAFSLIYETNFEKFTIKL
jgi:hypothetical protein